MKYILIIQNKAHEIIPEFDPVFPGVPITDRYAPDFLAQCVAVSDDTAVEIGMSYADGEFSWPPEQEE